MWPLILTDSVRGEFQTTVLPPDYDDGSKMAISVDAAPVAVPIAIPGSDRIVSARVYMVGSVDASERDLTLAGEIGPEDVDAVIDKLQTLL